MRFLKTNVLLRLANSYLIDSPQPASINYAWNFGSLLAVCLIIQILTGVFLAMHYVPNIDLAFDSVEHIMRDVVGGWLIRYTHANTASFFFIFIFAHIGRGLYYGSYQAPRVLVWSIGVIILVLLIATAFLGYLHSPKWVNIDHSISAYAQLAVPIISSSISAMALPSISAITPTNKTYPGVRLGLIKSGNCFSRYRALGKNLVKREYSTNTSSYKLKLSERLNRIHQELLLSSDPVYAYENLHLESTRQQILKDTKGLSGIYIIINKTTKDYYIGSASTNRLYARFSNHLINFRGSKIVKHAVKKYQLENFAFMILELYPNIVNVENNKELIDLEDKYLKLLLPNYNILTEAGSSFGYKHTELDRKKMKDNYSQERRDKIGNLNRNKKLSDETIEKLRASALNRDFSAQWTEEARKKCITNTRPVILYNFNGTIYGEYATIAEAAEAINCSPKTIRRALQTPKKIVRRQLIVKDLSDLQV